MVTRAELDIWIMALALNDFSIVKYELDRPTEFGKEVSVVNDEPIVVTNRGLEKYTFSDGAWSRLIKSYTQYPSEATVVFEPILGTSSVFYMRQVCGMGCDEPDLGLYDYVNKTLTKVPVEENLEKEFTVEIGIDKTYRDLSLYWVNSDQSQIGLRVGGDEAKYLLFDNKSLKWEVVKELPEEGTFIQNQANARCNPVYVHDTVNGFSRDACRMGTVGETVWQITDNSQKLQIKNIKDEKIYEEEPPQAPPSYSPFAGSPPNVRISSTLFANDKIWTATERGLAAYSLTEKTWKLYAVGEGLVSNEVTSFAVTDYAVWVTTRWGGLSVVPLR